MNHCASTQGNKEFFRNYCFVPYKPNEEGGLTLNQKWKLSEGEFITKIQTKYKLIDMQSYLLIKV